MRGWKTFFLSGVLFLFAFQGIPPIAGSVPTKGAKEAKIKEIESKLSKERERLDALGLQEKDLLNQLAILEREVAQKRRLIREIGEKVASASKEAKQLEKELRRVRSALEDVETRLAKRLLVLYKNARKGYLRVLAGARDMQQFMRRVKYLNAVVKEDRKGLAELASQEGRFRKEISHIEEELHKKGFQKDIEERRLSELKADLESKVIRLMKVHKEKQFYETAVQELELAAHEIKNTLLGIEKRKSYREVLTPSQFQACKGKLLAPLTGKVIRGKKFLHSRRPRSHKGIFIEGPSGGQVRAVFPGKVEFSGRLKGFGEMIIVNHGSRFFTISAHLLERKKEEGDMVKRGEVIGLAGRNNGSKGSRVYFEIRKGEKNLDPLEWLKIK